MLGQDYPAQPAAQDGSISICLSPVHSSSVHFVLSPIVPRWAIYAILALILLVVLICLLCICVKCCCRKKKKKKNPDQQIHLKGLNGSTTTALVSSLTGPDKISALCDASSQDGDNSLVSQGQTRSQLYATRVHNMETTHLARSALKTNANKTTETVFIPLRPTPTFLVLKLGRLLFEIE